MASAVELLDQLHPGLRRYVSEKWDDLTAIQKAAWPILLAGEDAVVEAPTAGGKTEAVLFPALTRVARDRAAGVCILYLAPLRALLNNLRSRGEDYAALCNLHAFKWHGDVAQRAKVDAFSAPPELLMTTPESVEAILLRKAAWRRFFENLAVVIIDEAHNFASGDRGGHLASLLERLEQATKRSPQRVALSATVGNPGALLEWLAGSSREPGRYIRVEAPPKEKDWRIEHFNERVDDEETPPEQRARYRRFIALNRLLPGNRSLVFVTSRSKAEGVARSFAKYSPPTGRKLRIRTHHSNVSRYFREEAEELIKASREVGIDAIVSTSTLELGIDIGEIDRVVQMGALASPSAFLQRVGRTGRRPGHPQVYRGMTLKEGDLLLQAATVSLGSENRSEALELSCRCFHLLAHQLICLALQDHGVRPGAVWEVLKKAHCFSGITEEEFYALVDHMTKEGYLRQADGVLVTGDRTEKEFLGAGWRRLFAVFDSAPLYEVRHYKTHIGTLSVSFVESLEVPFFFVLAGRLWKAVKVDSHSHVVQANPGVDGQPPRWESVWGLDVPFATAQEVGRILHGGEIPCFVNEEGRAALGELQDRCRQLAWQRGRVLVVPRSPVTTHVLTYAGDRINRTLSFALRMLGVGETHANYRKVKVRTRDTGKGHGVEQTSDALESLRSGDWSDAGKLETALQELLPRIPFSPFTRCLPPDLAAKASGERSLDIPGLLNLLQKDPTLTGNVR